MEGIDEMWMPCEYRRPHKVPVLGEPYSMYGGWSRTEQGALMRGTPRPQGGRNAIPSTRPAPSSRPSLVDSRH